MFALIETETVPESGVWHRLQAFLRGETGVRFEERRRWDTKVLEVTVTDSPEESPARREKRMELALRGVAQRGVRVIVPPRDFCYAGLLDKWGLVLADPIALYRRMAVRLAEFILSYLRCPPVKIGLTVCANRMTPELMRIVEALCLRVGRLAFCGPGNWESAARGLHASYGISLLDNPSASQLAEQDVFIVFDPLTGALPVKPDSIVLWLDGTSNTILPGRHINGARLRAPAKYAPAPDVPPETLLTVLLACGVISQQQISVGGLTWNGKPFIF